MVTFQTVQSHPGLTYGLWCSAECPSVRDYKCRLHLDGKVQRVDTCALERVKTHCTQLHGALPLTPNHSFCPTLHHDLLPPLSKQVSDGNYTLAAVTIYVCSSMAD